MAVTLYCTQGPLGTLPISAVTMLEHTAVQLTMEQGVQFIIQLKLLLNVREIISFVQYNYFILSVVLRLLIGFTNVFREILRTRAAFDKTGENYISR